MFAKLLEKLAPASGLTRFMVAVQAQNLNNPIDWKTSRALPVYATEMVAAARWTIDTWRVGPRQRVVVWAPGFATPRLFMPGSDGIWEIGDGYQPYQS